MLSLNLTVSMMCNVITELLEALYWLKIVWQPTATVAIHKDSICWWHTLAGKSNSADRGRHTWRRDLSSEWQRETV